MMPKHTIEELNDYEEKGWDVETMTHGQSVLLTEVTGQKYHLNDSGKPLCRTEERVDPIVQNRINCVDCIFKSGLSYVVIDKTGKSRSSANEWNAWMIRDHSFGKDKA